MWKAKSNRGLGLREAGVFDWFDWPDLIFAISLSPITEYIVYY